MLTPILIGLAILVVLFVAIAASRPSDFRVTRSIVIAAPAKTVFERVNNLHQWETWNPWGKLDPNAKMTYDGPPAGIGASYAWTGNCKVGTGRNTIVESKPDGWIQFRLEFVKPMKAVNTAEFTFKSEGAQTAVMWTMTGKNNFVGKAVGLFINCDKMVGDQFEKGLADLKSVVEAADK